LTDRKFIQTSVSSQITVYISTGARPTHRRTILLHNLRALIL